MRAKHPAFDPPDDPNAHVWRYMNFPKFVSLLREGGLHFCRADALDDPLERMARLASDR